MSETMEATPATKFSHNEISDELDRLNRELSEMKELVSDTCVRAHKMEMELAILFKPDVLDALRNAEQDCGACVHALENTKST